MDRSATNPENDRRRFRGRLAFGNIVPLYFPDIDLPPEAYSTYYRAFKALDEPDRGVNPQKLHKNFRFLPLSNYRAVQVHPPSDARNQFQPKNANMHRNTSVAKPIAVPPDVPHRTVATFDPILFNIQCTRFFGQHAGLFRQMLNRGSTSGARRGISPLSTNSSGQVLGSNAPVTSVSAGVNTTQPRTTVLPVGDPDTSLPPSNIPTYVPAGGPSPYKSWNELPPHAKLTTSAAARQARKERHWRDPDTVDIITVEVIASQMDDLTGEIYDAIIDTSEAVDNPQSVPMHVLTTLVGGLPLLPTRKIVAMAYWVAELILDGCKHGFRDTMQPDHRLKQGDIEYKTWDDRKRAILNSFKKEKIGAMLVLQGIKPRTLAILYGPDGFTKVAASRRIQNEQMHHSSSRRNTKNTTTTAAAAAAAAASNTPVAPLTPVYKPYAHLSPADKPDSPAAARALRKERFGRDAPISPDHSSGWLSSSRYNKLAWVKTAYASVLSTVGLATAGNGNATARFRERQFYDERDLVAMLWAMADALEDGAARGLLVPWQRRSVKMSDRELGLAARLDAVAKTIATNKSVCVDLMDVGKSKILELIYGPESLAEMKERSRRARTERKQQTEAAGEQPEAAGEQPDGDDSAEDGSSRNDGTPSVRTVRKTVKSHLDDTIAAGTKRKAAAEISHSPAKRGRPRKK